MTNQPVLLKATNAMELNLRFPGHYADEETGNFYNYFRTYSPNNERYTQSDPIGLGGGLNRFAYVGGIRSATRIRAVSRHRRHGTLFFGIYLRFDLQAQGPTRQSFRSASMVISPAITGALVPLFRALVRTAICQAAQIFPPPYKAQ